MQVTDRMGMTLKDEGDFVSMTVVVPRDYLVTMRDASLDMAGDMLANALKRKRNQVVCDKEGHQPQSHPRPEFAGLVCDRCLLVLDQERYDRQMAVSRV